MDYRYIRELEYPEDVAEIIKAFSDSGHTISGEDADQAWRDYSDRHCATWLSLPYETSHIVTALLPHLTEVGGKPEEEIKVMNLNAEEASQYAQMCREALTTLKGKTFFLKGKHRNTNQNKQ